MNLLIVEDNQQMRCMIKSILGDLADQMYECSDGAEALPAYVQHRPDWVLMDLKMREMDGLEATRRIRSAYPEANIVIVTDYDDPELRCEARDAGACDYVLKENLLRMRNILNGTASSSNSLL